MQREELKRAIGSIAFKESKSGLRIAGSEGGPLVPWTFDFRALLLQPRWLNAYAELFWEHYAARYPFQVCGMESAAISLVAAIVMKGVERGTPVNGLYIRKSRKKDGLMKVIEGTPTNEPIILVDDLINSGKTFNKQIKILAEAQKKVIGIFALLSFRAPESYGWLTKNAIQLITPFTLENFGLPLKISALPKQAHELFDVLWHFQAKDPSHQWVTHKSAPVIDEERVYVGTDAGVFYALDQEQGEIAWEFKIGKHPEGKGIFSSPALGDGNVYFGAYDGTVYALKTTTGEKVWTYDDADWVGSSPALAPDLGMIFVGLEFGLWKKHGGVIALQIKTGKKIWEHHTAAMTHGSPLYIQKENVVIIGSNDGILYAHDAKTGAVRWTHRTGSGIKMRAAYDAKRRLVVCGSMDGTLYILSAQDGEVLFAKETGAGIYSSPLVVEDTVYVSSLDKYIYAIDLNTFTQRWEYKTGGRIFASPVLHDASLWIGSNDGCLYELDPESGKRRSEFQLTERIVSSIAYNEKSRRFFVPTCANEIYCMRRKNSASKM